jgi:hypothetical protein
VHGAAVSGPTLPATAWRLFMERSLAGAPSLDFPSPLSPPQFAPWRGSHAYVPTMSTVSEPPQSSSTASPSVSTTDSRSP